MATALSAKPWSCYPSGLRSLGNIRLGASRCCDPSHPVADMRSGGVYLVGALGGGSMENSENGGMKFGGLDRGESAEPLVFARVARIGSPIAEEGAM